MPTYPGLYTVHITKHGFMDFSWWVESPSGSSIDLSGSAPSRRAARREAKQVLKQRRKKEHKDSEYYTKAKNWQDKVRIN